MIAGKLDSHLFLRSLAPYAVVLLSTCGMYVVVDLFSNIGRISGAFSAGFTISDLAALYLLKLPAILLVILPLVQTLALSFATLGFIRRKEYIATLSAGISMRRMSVPFLAAGLIFALASFLVAEFVVPPLSPIEADYNSRLYSKPPELQDVVTLEISGDARYIYHLDILVRSKSILRASGFHCFIAENGNRKEIHAVNGTFNDGTKKWVLSDGKLLIYADDGSRQTAECNFMLTTLSATDYLSQLEPQSFHMKDLAILSGTPRFAYEFHRRMAVPLTIFLLALLIVPMSFSLAAGGMFASVGVAIFVALVFFVADFLISAAFGDSKPISVWLIPIFFGLAGVRAMTRIPT